MPLEPPPPFAPHATLKTLLTAINQHAGPEGYAVVLQRTKKSKFGIKRKAWIICDRGRKTQIPDGAGRRRGSSRHILCPFSLIAFVAEGTSGPWFLELKHPSHNHGPSEPGAHPVLRKLAMTDEMKDEISRQHAVHIAPSQVLSSLRLHDPTALNPLVTRRDLYNMNADLRRQELGPLTPIQALVRHLNDGDWVFQLQKDIRNQVTHLFFSKGTSQQLLKANPEVLTMDCTYKTNRFKLPLLVISGQTALHSSFFVAFAFIAKEKTEDYEWVIQQLKRLYAELEVPDPVVCITDMERGLMNAIFLVFSRHTTNHLLCTWHINKNVLANCRKDFSTKEAWDKFFEAWQKVMYASSGTEYEAAWETMNEKYYATHSDAMIYLEETYIRSFRRRFVKCFTDKVLHFGTTVTSRAEAGHAYLKRYLGTSTGDLKKVIDTINLVLTNQIHDISLAMTSAQIRFPMELRTISVIRDLAAHVAPNALRSVSSQYKLLTDRATVLPRCTSVFTTTTGLPCSHKIQDRMFRGEALMLEDVHPHWRFEKPTPPVTDVINPLLLVNDPEIVRPRGRPPGAENRRQVTFEASTNREPSQFERVEIEVEDADEEIAQVIHRADPAPGRGRGRGARRARGMGRGRGTGTGRGSGTESGTRRGGTISGTRRGGIAAPRRGRSAGLTEQPGHMKARLDDEMGNDEMKEGQDGPDRDEMRQDETGPDEAGWAD